jgi:hypothetical protein
MNNFNHDRDQVTLDPDSSEAVAAKPKQPRGFFDAPADDAGKPNRSKRANLTGKAEHTEASAEEKLSRVPNSTVKSFTAAIAEKLRSAQRASRRNANE